MTYSRIFTVKFGRWPAKPLIYTIKTRLASNLETDQAHVWRVFLCLPMSKLDYTKPPKLFADQVALLQRRGLVVDNPAKAERVLENISYNRLSNYWYPFLAEPKEDEIFLPSTRFKNIFKIYQFDSELRSLLFNAIEQIEVALRTQLIYHVSHQHSSGYGFLDANSYESQEAYFRSMLRIQEAVRESKQPFIVKFKKNYANQFPPAWKSFELLTFRSLYSIYKNLIRSPHKQKISDHFGLNHTVFESWIDTLVYVRNICAHHSRLWNIVLTISPVWPRRPRGAWVDRWENEPGNTNTNDKRLKTYAAICMVQFLVKKVNPYSTFKRKFFTLLEQFPEANEEWMGMPNGWKEQPLWQE